MGALSLERDAVFLRSALGVWGCPGAEERGRACPRAALSQGLRRRLRPRGKARVQTPVSPPRGVLLSPPRGAGRAPVPRPAPAGAGAPSPPAPRRDPLRPGGGVSRTSLAAARPPGRSARAGPAAAGGCGWRREDAPLAGAAAAAVRPAGPCGRPARLPAQRAAGRRGQLPPALGPARLPRRLPPRGAHPRLRGLRALARRRHGPRRHRPGRRGQGSALPAGERRLRPLPFPALPLPCSLPPHLHSFPRGPVAPALVSASFSPCAWLYSCLCPAASDASTAAPSPPVSVCVCVCVPAHNAWLFRITTIACAFPLPPPPPRGSSRANFSGGK